MSAAKDLAAVPGATLLLPQGIRLPDYNINGFGFGFIPATAHFPFRAMPQQRLRGLLEFHPVPLTPGKGRFHSNYRGTKYLN
jgi:hypothetical protein